MRHMLRTLCVASSAMVCVGLMAAALHGEDGRVDWPSYLGSPGNEHYSKLSQIDRSNVAGLREVWRFDTHQALGLETTPLIVAGVMYAYTPNQKVIALDGRNGKLLWSFDSHLEGTGPDRGLTYWTDGEEKRLFAAVMNYVYALDPATGKAIETFGDHGRIDLRVGLGRDPEKQSIVLTSPGVIYKDLLIVGDRLPETAPAAPGDIRAYDVRSGARRWIFHTIPHPGEFGYTTWPKDAWKTAGAANNWAGMAIDQEHGIVYVPTGSAVPDFYGGERVGDDLFADCLLALNAETGKRIWYFQGVHHDLWDRDFPSPPTLVTVHRDGTDVPAIVQTTKQGILFVFNRLTGEPFYPITPHAVPASDVPGERSAAWQPITEKPAPFARQEITEDTLTDRTPEVHRWAVEQFRKMQHTFPYTPFRLGVETLVMPSFEGGGEWGGGAVDPDTAVLYLNANDYASIGGLVENAKSSSGRSTYLSQCSACHGANRTGAPPEFPSLVTVDQRFTDPQLETLLRQGRGRMPAFPNLDGTRLQELLRYVRTGIDTDAGTSGEAGVVPAAVAETQTNRDGEAVYLHNCAICHGEKLEGVGTAFPALKGVGQRLGKQQVTTLVHEGKGRMPGFPALQGQRLNDLLHYLGAEDIQAAAEAAQKQYTMTGYRRFNDPDGYPAVAPPWGTLNAIDLNTGEYLWRRPLGEYPALAAKGVKETGTENYGGPLVTAGGLIFIGATDFDNKFRAFDKQTGKLLWEAKLPFPGNATPATYSVDGKQYVVIASGGGGLTKGALGGVYVVYALP